MCEYIKIRDSFSDIDIEKMSYIEYLPYREIPQCTDYRSGEARTIVLRNKVNNDLELIKYKLTGAVRFSSKPGFYWFWGDIESKDHNCCLVFYFRPDGKFNKAVASFCGKSPDSLSDENERIKCAAEIVAQNIFG